MITVVGAGFAGVEAAWALASRGERVRLYEMRPVRMTPAHTTPYFAELVCSNSFKSKSPTSPAGQLKAEMDALGSIVLATAREHEVPAGEALGVDRDKFGEAITRKLEEHPLIEVVREEFTPDMANELLGSMGTLILATGPLTSPEISDWLANLTGRKHLYFYDAVSPTVDASSLDRSIVFAQSRYDKGEGDDYLNCPFDKDTYEAFVQALVAAERVPIHAFEAGGVRGEAVVGAGYRVGEMGDGGRRGESIEERFLEQIKYFAGCTPIEAIAEKGARSLAFGNFKPVGLTDPRTGRRPWAALQLRPENKEKTLYSLVACQTRLKWGEQKRVFQMVPGLESADFVRYGVIHRNTYIEAPKTLTSSLEMQDVPGLFIAGQLTGVEGYVESAAMGIYAGLSVLARHREQAFPVPPRACAYGSLVAHLQDDTDREFAPMNINWGLLPEPEEPTRDKGIKRAKKLEAAQTAFAGWQSTIARSVNEP
ncbi:MAG: methylenetetrahydrofolate--tRNA-(uracil(54)-C(5))-methyltransferase (FADH(2)-oxidizing) TrmFO [Chlorobia bacterium]|nr:methylenetetrahydrofolate--tRNA-(uracil(54)-C(5))-methyltransferase (FADH(2)-oxidizing) TrmFO [Fimbriimonadaceae bacterium]